MSASGGATGKRSPYSSPPTHQGGRHVAFFLPDFGGGGAERVQLSVIRELVGRGHRVDLVLALGGGALLPLLPPEVRLVEMGASRLVQSVLPLARYLRTERPDALHAVMWPLTVIAPLAHRIARSNALLVVSEQAALSRQYPALRDRGLLRLTSRLAWPHADARIACAVGTAEDNVALSGLPRHAFEVIINPTSPPRGIATTPEVEQLWGDASHRLITVGRLNPQKNQAMLLRAFATLFRTRPSARLMLLGTGPLAADLKALAADLGIADAVIFSGFHLSAWPFFASADLFVLSSDFEGMPLVLAEAMHAGLKVVSTDCISGPRELLDGGRFGRLVPVGDEQAFARAMEAALDEVHDPQAQRDRAEAISGQASVDRYADLLTGAGAA